MTRKGRNWAIALIALVALAIAGWFLFQRQIAETMFERAVNENVGRDPSATLPDGINVYMCGTGSPMPDVERAGPCIGVLAGDQALIFDVGSGSVRTLGRMGFPLGRTERLFLTHLHSDHFDGLGELMVQAWVGGGRDTPLPVWGTTGTRETVAGFNQAYRVDSTYRTAHHGPEVANPDGYGLEPHEFTLPETPGQVIVLREGDLTVTAFSVSHAPVENAIGYRIDYKGRSIVISGDTSYDANLVTASRGADILFHEALDPEMVGMMGAAAERNGNSVVAKIALDILDYHTPPDEAARAAHEAGVRELVFYHIIPPMPSALLHSMFLNGVSENFSGSVHMAEDGMLISLPANSDAIEYISALR